MKQYTYHKEQNELREQASMDMSKYGFADEQFVTDYINSNKSLLTITCTPQCREVWEDGQSVKEGEFEVKYVYDRGEGKKPAICNQPYYDGIGCTHTKVAYPIQQERESEDELWNEVVGIIIKAYTYKSIGAILEFKDEMQKLKPFSLTRRILILL